MCVMERIPKIPLFPHSVGWLFFWLVRWDGQKMIIKKKLWRLSLFKFLFFRHHHHRCLKIQFTQWRWVVSISMNKYADFFVCLLGEKIDYFHLLLVKIVVLDKQSENSLISIKNNEICKKNFYLTVIIQSILSSSLFDQLSNIIQFFFIIYKKIIRKMKIN